MTGQEVYGTIFVNFGGVTPWGLTPGTGERFFIMTGDQLQRLLNLIGEDAVKTLAAIVEKGDLRLDPPRIEVPRWGYEWPIEHAGLTAHRARNVGQVLKKQGFIDKTFGSKGAAGGAIGVLAAERFNWPQPVTTSGGRTVLATPSLVDNAQNAQVSGRLGVSPQNEPNATPEAVDNFIQSFERSTAERSEPDGRSVVSTSDSTTPQRQVSAFGASAAERPERGAPSKEGLQEGKSLLGMTTGEGAPLTRTNLHRLLCDPAVVEAMGLDEVRAIDTLASVFAPKGKASRAVAILDYFDRPHGDPHNGALVERDLSGFVYDLITVKDPDLPAAAEALRNLLASKHARMTAYPPRELICSVVVAITAAMDSDVESVPGFLVWATKQKQWANSAAVTRLVASINAVVTPAEASQSPAAVVVHDEEESPLPALPVRQPNLPEPTVVDIEMEQRGDDYWPWLCEIASETEYGDPQSMETIVRRSRRFQSIIIKAHYAAVGASGHEPGRD